MIKKDWVYLFLVIALILVQIFASFVYAYFYFVMVESIFALILFFLHKKKKFSYYYDFWLWFIIFISLIAVFFILPADVKLDRFFNSPIVSIFLMVICFFISLGKISSQDKKLSRDLNKIVFNKKTKMIETSKDKHTIIWPILYLALIIIGQKLFGIGGATGGLFIIFGIHKTIRNEELSKTKKWIYSIFYVIGGLLIAFILDVIIQAIFFS